MNPIPGEPDTHQAANPSEPEPVPREPEPGTERVRTSIAPPSPGRTSLLIRIWVVLTRALTGNPNTNTVSTNKAPVSVLLAISC